MTKVPTSLTLPPVVPEPLDNAKQPVTPAAEPSEYDYFDSYFPYSRTQDAYDEIYTRRIEDWQQKMMCDATMRLVRAIRRFTNSVLLDTQGPTVRETIRDYANYAEDMPDVGDRPNMPEGNFDPMKAIMAGGMHTFGNDVA